MTKSKLWRITRLKEHPQIEDGIMLSVRLPAEGYTRGSQYVRYGLHRDEAMKLAEGIIDALSK